MFDGKAFGEQMVEVVRSYVDEVYAPLRAENEALTRRIIALEELEPRVGEAGRDGADGRDADPELMRQMIAEAVAALPDAPAGRDGEAGRDGVDGRDGCDADMEALKAHCAELIAAMPKPENGKDGRDGVDGRDGADGQKGDPGRDGNDGADGVSLAGALIDRDGVLNLTLSNGEVKALGRVEGRDGRDGKDGERGSDGQAWDDMEIKRTGLRTVELSFDHGDRRNTFEMDFPVPVYRGVFAEGEAYEPGDMATWAGSLWHCNEPTVEKPGDGSKAWTLAAKRGRDGKDFAGPQPTPGGKVKI